MFTLVRSKGFGRHFGYAALAYMFRDIHSVTIDLLSFYPIKSVCFIIYMSKRECKMKL